MKRKFEQGTPEDSEQPKKPSTGYSPEIKALHLAWNVVPTQAFRRDFRKLDSEIRRRVEEAIDTFSGSEDPRKLGHRLHGRWEGAYSFEIGLQYRLVYRVNFADKLIELMAVGTHKIYG